jgi:hypothetical protein
MFGGYIVYSRFGNIVERVAEWHIAKERPQDAFGAAFFDLRAKVKGIKDKLATEAMESLKKGLVKDLTDAGYEVVSIAFALGQYRGSKFITSAKFSVKVGTEAKAKKLAGQLLKWSPKYNLKEYPMASQAIISDNPLCAYCLSNMAQLLILNKGILECLIKRMKDYPILMSAK